MAVFDGQIPIEYRYKVILAADSCDRSPRGIPANNPGRNCSVWEERNRQSRRKTLYLKGSRRICSEVRSASLTKPNFHHTSQCPSITKSHQTYHVPDTTDITVSS
ncbi:MULTISPECIES: hypothetical protein [unclassified Microcoleus]|uniref:hypothetical protein n=1 Tax=unclassified Microcoleus TaxID=2642155 RepID=UPI002FD315F3